MKGKVQTVLGQIEPEKLGLTLTHEHLLHGLPSIVFKKEHSEQERRIPHDPTDSITLENVAWVKQFPYYFEENLGFSDEIIRAAVRDEMHFFKKCGGGTIVDNGSVGIRTKDQPQFLTSISKECGINVVAGTGFYVTSSVPSSALKLTEEEMTAKMREDLLIGIEGSGVKCGVIGEIGCSWPLTDFEKRSLQSSAVVQFETGCPAIIHPGRDKNSPEEIIRVFQEAGGKAGRTVMSHLERTLHTKEDLVEFASLGSYCEFDLFGTEASHYQLNDDIDMPSDAQRLERLRYLIDEGYDNKIVIAHDIHTKHRLMKFGGHGFSHILFNVLPKMSKRGFSKDNIQKIMYENPRNWLTFH